MINAMLQKMDNPDLLIIMAGRFLREYWLTWPGILITIVIILLIPLSYRAYSDAKNYFRPSDRTTKTREWLQLMYATISADEAEFSMAAFARKYPVREKARTRVLADIQWRVYLNLQYIRRQLSRTPARTISLIPASLWLFENYNLIYREIKRLQGAGNLRQLSRLPVLNISSTRSYPRIYLIAHKIISGTNGHIHEESLVNYISDYQKSEELTSKELWALPHVLSLCLLERIVDEAIRLINNIHVRMRADDTAERVAAALRRSSEETAAILQQENFWNECTDETFLAHFIYRLRNLSVDESEIVRWLASLSGVGVEDYQRQLHNLITQDRQREALAESTVSALIISLKEVGEMNWEQNYRKVSLAEATLALDPAGVYDKVDGNTRARYRRQIQKLADKYSLDESVVATKALQLARLGDQQVHALNGPGAPNDEPLTVSAMAIGAQPQNNDTDQVEKAARDSSDPMNIPWDELPVPNHIGTFLIGRGRSLLDDYIANRAYRPLEGNDRQKTIRSIVYIASITILTLLQLWLLYRSGAGMFAENTVAAVFFFINIGILAVGVSILLTHSTFTRIIKPKPQLSMDFTEHIPDEFRTFVVMPVIIGNVESARTYAARLERYYLANKQENLYFAVLGDLRDSPTEFAPDDEEIIAAATKAIDDLNDRYPGTAKRFSLLIRSRKWNESEQCWMCWERKRGKLEELNALLSGDESTGFKIQVGSPEIMQSFRFVITLDADTELVRESGALLVGIMAHPLNWPVIDPKTKRIVSGYAIVQSEITSRVSDARSSFFSRVFAGESGIDSYASVISDVYQDTFDEGIFVGKGIYDYKVLHILLGGMIPENSVLSHDLLESSLTRCAFASGIRLLDSTPPNFAAFARRDHRWIRGDWQLLPWIFSTSPINWLSRWKMLDNLRRSITPIASVVAVLLNVAFFPAIPWLWLPFVVFGDFWQLLSLFADTIFRKLQNSTVRVAHQILLENAGLIVIQALLYVIFLPFRAWMSLDAITRTLVRMFITHRYLLEWQTSESVEKSLQNSLSSYIRLFLPSLPAAILLGAAAIWQLRGLNLFLLLVQALLWLAAPWFAWRVSLPPRTSIRYQLPTNEEKELRILARRTWRFFEDFSTAENNWLCPDNYQEFPGPKLADKTSPTNLGMQLLSALSACDFGYITLCDLVEHCDNVLRTIQKMPKWNGHLYNWYFVQTLELVWPNYVSVVDSGNFLTSLITLKNGLLELAQKPLLNKCLVQGARDTLAAGGLDPDVLQGSLTDEQEREQFFESLTAAAAQPELDSYYTARILKFAESLQTIIKTYATPAGLDVKLSLKDLAKLEQPAAMDMMDLIRSICMEIDYIVDHADFKPLYDEKHRLFHIGYNVSTQSSESGHYDLLASEARAASFLAIAKGDVPQKHWFSLGRPLTLVKGVPALVSWSGTMFEYLMPNLIMRAPRGTLIERSNRAAVQRQIMHGKKFDIPWGVSESQYFMFDVDSNYQYMAFGMQYLRLQSSMRPARVVAPYATALALGIKPEAAIANLRHLKDIGASGIYGMYEALDFSRPNSATLQNYSLVQTFMAHHQGMIMTSLNNFLNNRNLQRRFHKEPMVQSTEVLLEEKRSVVLVLLARYGYSINIDQQEYQEEQIEDRRITDLNPETPEAHVLSNGRYLLMLTSEGQGFSSCNNTMIHRWRSERVGSSHGQFIYIRNLETNQLWSSTYYPTIVRPDHYEAIFSADKVKYLRRDGLITTTTEATLSPLEDFELRRVTFTNHGDQSVLLEATSYLEVVNDTFMSEASHPAFNKLFLEMEYLREDNALLASRRQRSPDEKNGVVLHKLRSSSPFERPVEFETDRRAFLGRGGTKQQPHALRVRQPLSGRSGFSNDPIMSLRAVFSVPAGQSVSVSFITAWSPDRDSARNLSQSLQRSMYDDDIFRQALTSSTLERKYLNLSSSLHNAIQEMVGPLYYPTRAFRDDEAIIRKNKLGQSSLWRFGISGDDPIILMRVRNLEDLAVVRDALAAYEFLRQQTVAVDLVLINEEEEGYALPLHNRIQDLTSILKVYNGASQKPSLFLLRRSQMTDEEATLLAAVARIVINPQKGIYRDRRAAKTERPSQHAARIIQLPDGQDHSLLPDSGLIQSAPQLEFFNGIGGFANDGTEYEIWPANGRSTPAPWINVMANPDFGCLVSETGGGYTWAGNSRENKLTTWSNDPVTDPASEAVYIKDRESGAITTPAALQPGTGKDYQVRHGFGYSEFTHTGLELKQKMTVFVAAEAPLKLTLLTLHNTSNYERSFSVVHYAELVLGVMREQTAPYIVSKYSADDDLFLAHNVYAPEDKQPVAFLFGSEPITSYTGDRTGFLGLGSSINFPNGLAVDKLSNLTGAGLDPCAAIQMDFTIGANETKTIVLGLGQTSTAAEAAQVAARFKQTEQAETELQRVRAYWQQKLGQIRVKSDDRAMDLMLNGWLLYQTLSCRIMARTAFYQSGGAFGFRDQLQDTLALLHSAPEYAADQIRLCCSRQFIEGDVQHWWHNETGIGVRTLITDDLLWLPFAVAAYVERTGSLALLKEQIPFIEGEPLAPGEHERMFAPRISEQSASVYEHCLRAIERASRFGAHGIPLMGGGDWNDGMNRVGVEGRGESVWLGWFLCTVLKRFAPICRRFGDNDLASGFDNLREELRVNIETHAWDGHWYKRAWFDDGSPMGSHLNAECQIDSISQSWSVLSGAGNPERTSEALEAANRHLVHRDVSIIQLLTPPFNVSDPDPGYIRGYFPGIRENGGQYTHAAVWLAMAFARAGRGKDARELMAMLNPINFTSTPRDMMRYEREPYVVAADINIGEPFTGKGGWSWYTGSSGWLYQAMLQSLLGIRRESDHLILQPAFPAVLKAWEVDYRNGDTVYNIRFENPTGAGKRISALTIDGKQAASDNRFYLLNDGKRHEVVVRLTDADILKSDFQ